jgi:hypothetical protein
MKTNKKRKRKQRQFRLFPAPPEEKEWAKEWALAIGAEV